jgi:hypothetical protein
LVENNSLYHTHGRDTANPVTLLNINAASNWVVRGNLIADFAKTGGNRISFGATMKGNSADGLFERNVVICEMHLPADEGIRGGLSLGGGGTGTAYCRDRDCSVEHTRGVIRNNIIYNCSHDVGIYLNTALYTGIYNNFLFNTLGIDVRFEPSTAAIANNIISGRVKDRDGGVAILDKNIIATDCVSTNGKFTDCPLMDWFKDVKKMDLAVLKGDGIKNKASASQELKDDFCGNPLAPNQVDIGPLQYSNGQTCRPTAIHAQTQQ